mgnify:CR=1 FL=1|tara:strand:- start:3950 stop:4174 length:225 start_codon:yes stop_codon:yes gene_type:complete
MIKLETTIIELAERCGMDVDAYIRKKTASVGQKAFTLCLLAEDSSGLTDDARSQLKAINERLIDLFASARADAL